MSHNAITVNGARGNTFFLADSQSWRKMKHIYAAALGCPMLHYEWLVDIERDFNDTGSAKVMDSKLYFKHRLPIGLDLSKGFYPLQRASHARMWESPACFEGMTVALALETSQETEWRMILKACGATVKTLAEIQKGMGKISVDCCLFASTSLPPHTMSKPQYVTKLMQFIDDDVPLLE